jgi:hypothetical protein
MFADLGFACPWLPNFLTLTAKNLRFRFNHLGISVSAVSLAHDVVGRSWGGTRY